MISTFSDEVFCEVYRHLISAQYQRLMQLHCPLLPEPVLQVAIEDAFLPLLRRVWERVLIVELNLADQDGLLQGKTQAQRFNYFTEQVCYPDNMSALCAKYPDLLPLWQGELVSFSTALQLMIERVVSDISLASGQIYNDPAVARINSLTAMGDPHNGMQQTARVSFVTATGQRRILYYKPRNLAVDKGFYDFIDWWNSQCPITHCAPKVMQCDGYGWAEAISHQDCQTIAQVRAYYRRYGSLIALTHLFAATDLHMENIIACGAYPVIIDIETLFSCTLEAEKSAAANYHLYTSLLLPIQTVNDEVEISPLSARANVQTNIDILVNPQHRSSNLKLERKKLVTGKCDSQLRLKGKVVDFSTYYADIIGGLTKTLTFLTKNQAQVLQCIKENMGSAPIRIVVQPTEEYAKILRNLYHPDVLRRRQGACCLRALASATHNGAVLDAEIAALAQGDIPYFHIKFDQKFLLTGQYKPVNVTVFQSPIEKMTYQFNRLSVEFIRQSILDVEHAFLLHQTRTAEKTETPHKAISVARGANYQMLHDVPDSEWLDQLAMIVFDRLIDSAIVFDDRYYWRSIGMNDEAISYANLCESDLYQGTAGVALAFHIVGRQLNIERYLEFADVLSEQVLDDIDDLAVAELGAFSGMAGSVWAACAVNRPHLSSHLATLERSLAKLLLRLVSGEWHKYEDIDYVGGAAGTLSMLLRLHGLYRDYPVADKILRLADYCFNLIKEQAGGLRLEAETLLGFAHGTAGVSAVLAQYMTYTGVSDPVALAIINGNIERETRYRTNQGWPRLGKDEVRDNSWCHGAVGIGYSRLFCKPYISSSVFEKDMQIIKARLGEPQRSMCLCHGMIGDYYFARTMGWDTTAILQHIRRQTEQHGITTNYGLNGFEMIGALNGVTSLFTGDAIMLNKI